MLFMRGNNFLKSDKLLNSEEITLPCDTVGVQRGCVAVSVTLAPAPLEPTASIGP